MQLVIPELKRLVSSDLDYGNQPVDASDCEIYCEAEIGMKGELGADVFFFTVATPKFLLRQGGCRWGRGYLIVDSFSWEAVESAIKKLLAQSSGNTWDEVAKKLNMALDWEFDNYQD